jgi:hypothetical protein
MAISDPFVPLCCGDRLDVCDSFILRQVIDHVLCFLFTLESATLPIARALLFYWLFVTPIFKEQMEYIILCASRDQSHIR